MDIDFKSILLVIIILGVIAATIFAGYKILGLDEEKEPVTPTMQANLNTPRNVIHDFSTIKSDKKDNVEEIIEEPSDDLLEGTESIEEESEETENSENTFQPTNALEKNNYFPKNSIPGEESVKRIHSYTRMGGKKLRYSIPKDWATETLTEKDPVTGSYIHCNFALLSEYGDYEGKNITHEEFLQDFMNKEKQLSSDRDVEFRTRELEIGSNNKFTIIEKVETYSITNYMVFLENGGVYYISITSSNDEDYNDELLKDIDNIFSTAYITTV